MPTFEERLAQVIAWMNANPAPWENLDDNGIIRMINMWMGNR